MTTFGIYFTAIFAVFIIAYFVYLYIDYKKAKFNKELKDAEMLINDEIKKSYSDRRSQRRLQSININDIDKYNKLTLKNGLVRYIKKGKRIK